MRDIIEEILQGNFNYENGSLDFSCSKIEISLYQGQQYEGSFRILASSGTCTGTVTSSDLRMECLTEEFNGSEEEILYRFHGENLEEGDVVKGDFSVISSHGEYYIPFVVSVEYRVMESSIGAVRNLFHFANLAKSSWREAVRLYYSPQFSQILTGRDSLYADDYRALSVYEGMEQSVEEFLVQVNKKQRVDFLVEESELTLEQGDELARGDVTETVLNITRNGWGFTQLFVECRGDFLFTEKEVLTDDDFLGNRCHLPVFVDSGRCIQGKNFGEVCLYNCYVTLRVPVTVKYRSGAFGKPELYRQSALARLTGCYLEMRTKKIGTAAWLKESGALAEKLAARNPQDCAARLFQAQLLITEERYNEAGWLLDNVAEILSKQQEEGTLTAYYLYLTTLIHRETPYVDKVTKQVERIYDRDDANWRVAWLLLYLSPEYRKSVTGKWQFLEKQFHRGCASPVLYMETVAMLNNNPALLRKLGRFELQTVWYGVRKELLRQETVEQLLYLTGRVREFSPVLYRILTKLYEQKKDVRILQEICTLLIKGARADRRYFRWYSAGVDAKLRITNLFEYYMMSLDLRKQQELPRTVLLYFSYQNHLDDKHSAYLYDYIVRNADRLSEIYEVYRPRMEEFVLDQIRKEHISRPLANLYNRLLQPGMIDEETSGPLSRLLFAHLIRVEDDRLQKVFVYHPDDLSAAEYLLDDGQTWVALYGSRYTIAFEDAWQHRFVRTVEYTLEKLMIPGKYLRLLTPCPKQGFQLDLYLCSSEREETGDPQENIRRCLRVLDSGRVSLSLRRELYLRILRAYYDMDDMRSLDEYLALIPGEELSVSERADVVRYMTLRGQYDLAGEWMKQYGPYFIDPKVLVRLISPLMEQNRMVEDPLLTAAAFHAFSRQKYDGVVLQYLAMYGRGMTKNLRDIWKSARSFEVDCYRLSETILVQMLYSGAFVGEKMDIFRYYVQQGAKPEVEAAFLAQCAFDFFVRQRVTEGEIFREIHAMYVRGEPVQRVCKLALLKYDSEHVSALDEDEKKVAQELLREFFSEGVHLAFFREFRDFPWVRQELADKTIVEYRCTPGCRACIHYVITCENGGPEEYVSEYMREVYGGVCFREFILFFGETLQYYITEEKDGASQLLESGTLQKTDHSGAEGDSRYRLVNDIVISRAMQDTETMDNLLEEYFRKDYLNSRLFQLKGKT